MDYRNALESFLSKLHVTGLDDYVDFITEIHEGQTIPSIIGTTEVPASSYPLQLALRLAQWEIKDRDSYIVALLTPAVCGGLIDAEADAHLFSTLSPRAVVALNLIADPDDPAEARKRMEQAIELRNDAYFFGKAADYVVSRESFAFRSGNCPAWEKESYRSTLLLYSLDRYVTYKVDEQSYLRIKYDLHSAAHVDSLLYQDECRLTE